jgi:hypothetical protein
MRKAFILSVLLGVAAEAPVMSDPLDTAGLPTSGHRAIHQERPLRKQRRWRNPPARRVEAGVARDRWAQPR